MQSLLLPDSAVKFIAFQRTDALRFPHFPGYGAIKRIVPKAFYNLAVAAESRLRPQAIKSFYAADINAEFDTLAPHLPASAQSILDVGCGVAGIDALLWQHYLTDSPEIYLLDRSATDASVFYGFKSRGAFYNSLEIAAEVLRANKVPPAQTHLIEATDDNAIKLNGPIDIVVSLISWGFHYPVATYLEPAHAKLRDGGRLFLDVRKGTDGLELLRDKFSSISIIVDEAKFDRVCAIK